MVLSKSFAKARPLGWLTCWLIVDLLTILLTNISQEFLLICPFLPVSLAWFLRKVGLCDHHAEWVHTCLCTFLSILCLDIAWHSWVLAHTQTSWYLQNLQSLKFLKTNGRQISHIKFSGFYHKRMSVQIQFTISECRTSEMPHNPLFHYFLLLFCKIWI